MNRSTKLYALLAGVVLAAAACSSSTGGASTAPSAAASAAAPSAAPSAAASAAASPIAGGLLDKVLKAGVLKVSTDPNYAPQSVQKPDGTYEGFDIDVANEIAKRLGVPKVEFVTPGWDVITAGSWAGRWDISVGSMTITTPRQAILAFTSPYYYTPAQMTATTASGITTLDGLAGKTVCVGTATTYQDWLQGKLQSVSLGPVLTPPAGGDRLRARLVRVEGLNLDAGRKDAQGFLSSSTTIDAAITNGTPIVKVGTPVFVEQLAASMDKAGPDPSDFQTAVSKIIDDMHADGTLTAMSMKWFKADLTQKPAS